MPGRDHLFDLIKSMTKSEKRYFKVQAQVNERKGKSNYLLLFDALDNQTTYDEAKLLKKFRNETFIRHLPSTKYQLSRLIMKSLRAFHSGKSVDMQIRELLDEVEILSNKGLYKVCKRTLDKARTLAEKYERFKLLLEVQAWYWRLRNVEELKGTMKSFQDKIRDEREVLKLLEEYVEYAELKARVSTLQNIRQRARTAEEQSKFEAIMSHPSLSRDVWPSGFLSRINYLDAHAYYGLVKPDFREAFQNFKKVLDLWDANPHFKEAEEAAYLASIFNYISTCLFLEDPEAFMAGISRLRAFHPTNSSTEFKARDFAYFQELVYYMNFGDFGKGVALIREIEPWLSKNKEVLKSSRFLSFHYNITIFFFLHGRYSQALKWLNRILFSEKFEARQDIQDFARVFQLIIHHELGNHDLLEYLFRSTYRYLKKRKKLLDYERLLIDYIRRSGRLTGREEILQSFSELKRKFEEMAARPGSRKPVGLQELLFWLESKERDMPIEVLFKEKLAERKNSGTA